MLINKYFLKTMTISGLSAIQIRDKSNFAIISGVSVLTVRVITSSVIFASHMRPFRLVKNHNQQKDLNIQTPV